MPVSVRMKPDWDGRIIRGLDKALLEMTLDIHRRAGILAPFQTGALINSGRVSRTPGTSFPSGYTVTFGSSKVPYALRRHFENKKNPQTLHYLSRAGDAVARGDKTKYFRGKV